MLTPNAMAGFKDYVKATVEHAEYKIGSTWYRASLLDMYVDSGGRVCIDFTIDPTQGGTVTVSGVRLYDIAGQIWLEKVESIVRQGNQQGIFYRFTIAITEV